MKHIFSFVAAMLVVTVCNAQTNQKLSNLTPPTAVNVTLLPGGTTGSKNLGSDTKRWKNGYFHATVYGYGTGSSYGVWGSSSTYGVYGSSSYLGVYGTGDSYGTYGYSSAGTGATGQSSSGYGVYGTSSSSYGVYGYSGYLGVYGVGTSYGTYGYSSANYGALGSSSTGTGVYGSSSSGYGGSFYSSSSWALRAETNTGFYAGVFYGNVYSSGTYYGSDKNIKKNIQDFGNAMSIINKLKPKNYEFRDDGKYASLHLPKGNHYGLIAQDLEQVLPDLVNESKHEIHGKPVDPKLVAEGKASAMTAEKTESISIKAVNYVELIPIMIKAMQEQQGVIDKQQKQIDELKSLVTSSRSAETSNDAVTKTAGHSNGAFVKQNAPNPFSQNTAIQYYVPSLVKQAQLIVYGMDGSQLKSYSLKNGMNQVTINGGTLSSGQYIYSLVIDGKKIDSKNMVLTK